MIEGKDIHPQRKLYYLGAALLEIMKSTQENSFDYISLFNKFRQKEKISIKMFTLTLDWLFILGLVEATNQGKIKKCF